MQSETEVIPICICGIPMETVTDADDFELLICPRNCKTPEREF